MNRSPIAHVAPSAEEARRHGLPALSRLLWALSGRNSDAARIYDTMQANGTAVFGAARDADDAIERLADHGIAHVALITRFGSMSQTVAARSLRMLSPNRRESVESAPFEGEGSARRALRATTPG